MSRGDAFVLGEAVARSTETNTSSLAIDRYRRDTPVKILSLSPAKTTAPVFLKLNLIFIHTVLNKQRFIVLSDEIVRL